MHKNRRLIHFDTLKGIAILLVVWGHVYYFGLNRYTDNAVYTFIDAIHMPLFVMLSGFFFTKPLNLTRTGVISFWRDKAVRLLLPLLILPTLYNWIHYGFSLGLPLNMYLGEYWFTYTLFSIFLVFYLYRCILSFRDRDTEIQRYRDTEIQRYRDTEIQRYRDTSITIIIGIGIIVMIHLLSLWIKVHEPNWYHRLNLRQLDWLYKYFWLGFLLGRYPKLEEIIRRESVSAILFFLFSGLLYIECTWEYQIGERIPLTTSGLLFVYATIYKLTTNNGRGTQILSYLGRESLPIYLTHYFFVFNLTNLRPLLDSVSDKAIGWEILIAGVATIVILLPTLLIIKLLKSNRYLALLIYGETTARTTKK